MMDEEKILKLVQGFNLNKTQLEVALTAAFKVSNLDAGSMVEVLDLVRNKNKED